ncbi:MAG: type I-F CRISPR-associated protein Csy2 [Pseudomonas sp.]|nr:type I-F CRISPR-associated protein Csy2 [Pseudomonas sp.]
MAAFLVIPSMVVQGANLLTSPLLAGGPPVMAAAMFAHQLARVADTNDLGVVLVHHHRQDLGQWAYGKFHAQQRRGAVFIDKTDYAGSSVSLSLQTTMTAHMRVSLIVEFDNLQDETAVRDVLAQARFAGGQVQRHGDIAVFGKPSDAIQALPTGFVVRDMSLLLQERMAQKNQGRLEAMVNLLAARPNLEEGVPPWLAASTLGYAALTPFQPKAGAREGKPHAYAEPLTGLVRYQPLREIDRKDFKHLVWRYTWPRPDVFLLTQLGSQP